MNNGTQVDATATPLIAHVEVGGSLGGSTISLGGYLKYRDAKRFRHELLFYQVPPDSESVVNGRWPLIDLGLSIPPQSSHDHDKGRARHWIRTFLVTCPRLRAPLGIVREGWQLLARLPEAIRLARYFRQRGYALIHCNNSFTYQIPTVVAAWLARRPLVSHFRTLRRLTPWQRWLARRPVCIVAINRQVAEDLRRQGIRTSVSVCHDPVERPNVSTEHSSALRRVLLGKGTILVGTVTRLEDGKGIEDLLTAARSLLNQWPDVRYVIVGDGSRADVFKRLAGDWGLRSQVHFAGFQSNVFEYYPCFDVFVCPSHAEGGPLVVLEAMLTGKPVVATSVGWVSELIRDGKNGLVVSPNDPTALARAIESLLRNPSARQAMGARAAASVRELCDPAIQARRLDELFAQVLSRRC